MRQGRRKAGSNWMALGACTLCLALLLAGRTLCAGAAKAEKTAPTGCTLQSGKFDAAPAFPLGTATWRFSDGYGWREDPLTGEEAFHRGVDLACAQGTPVLSVLDGVVTMARQSGSYGNCIVLRHAGGQETLYAHLQYCYVRAGEVVQAGQPLGTAGQTGRATGAHLHFALRDGGLWCDPARALELS